MSQQPLIAFTQRISGEQYIGQHTASFDVFKCVRVLFPVYVPCRRPRLTYRDAASQGNQDPAEQPSTSSFRPVECKITGISWFTKDFINSCNLDSFLSAWVRISQQSRGRFLRYIESMDEIAVSLFMIADYALCAKENLDSNIVKYIWVSSILKLTGESDRMLSLPIDCMGNTVYSVYQHLRNHCTVEIVSTCQCGIQYHRDHLIQVSDLTQLKYMVHPSLMQRVDMPLCQNCNQQRVLRELNPSVRNWLHVFTYAWWLSVRSPLLEDIPKLITLGQNLYELGYLTYVQQFPQQTVYHEVSLQYIGGEFYFYDGALSPKFYIWTKKDYTEANAGLSSIVYFKI